MNWRETAAAERAIESERTVHLIDAEAIRKALLGDPGALTELEQGAAIVITDQWGLDRELTAAGLGVRGDSVKRAISRARSLAPARLRLLLAATAEESVQPVVDAVKARDAELIAEYLTDLDVLQLRALVIALADAVPSTTPAPDFCEATP